MSMSSYGTESWYDKKGFLIESLIVQFVSLAGFIVLSLTVGFVPAISTGLFIGVVGSMNCSRRDICRSYRAYTRYLDEVQAHNDSQFRKLQPKLL